MFLIFLLSVATVLQIAAAVLAFRLIRRTSYNSSWILLTVTFAIMAVQNIIRFVPYIDETLRQKTTLAINWLSILVSVLIVIATAMISRIFDAIRQNEKERKMTDKRVLNAIIKTEEKERRKLAKDLHDGLGPLLSTVRMQISTLKGRLTSPTDAEILRNTEDIIREAIKSTREISNNLSPHVLEDFGLVTAVKAFCTPINAAGGVSISLQTNLSGERFDEKVEIVLYRIFCELLNNAIKHAQARNIDIALNKYQNILSLCVSDDGVGFNVGSTQETAAGTGRGLSNIRSRVRSINGILNIESGEGAGTKAIIIVNLES